MKLVLPVVMLLAGCGALYGHHSFAADFSATPIVLKATIVRFVWMNPHSWVYLEVRDASGVATKWECEGSAPGGLVSNGWSRTTLKPGDQVTIEGYAAKAYPNMCKVRAVRLENGQRLLMGTPGEFGAGGR